MDVPLYLQGPLVLKLCLLNDKLKGIYMYIEHLITSTVKDQEGYYSFIHCTYLANMIVGSRM